MSSDKITGWIAYHFERGLYKNEANEVLFVRDLSIFKEQEFSPFSQAMSKYGWRIRPVEIVFTDEGEK